MIDLFLNEPQRDCGMSSCVNLKTKLDMNTDQIVDSKVTTMTDLGGNKSKVLLLKDESEIEAFKEELRLCIVVGQSEQLLIPRVSNWVAVKDAMPENCDQVFVKYENGKYGINEWWESDDCWKYEFDNMIVKEWCKPPCY